MINFHTIPYFLTALISTLLGIFVFARNPTSLVNRTWCRLGLTVSLWSMGFGAMLFSHTKSEAVFWGSLSHVGASFIPVVYFHFVLSLLSNIEKRIRTLYLTYGLGFFFAASCATTWLIKDYSPKLNFNYYFQAGFLYFWFIIMFFVVILSAVLELLKGLRNASGHPRNQLKYVYIATLIGFGSGATTFPLVFDIQLYPIGGLVFLYNIIITYAIVRYRLMDIKVALTRTGIFIAVYTLVLGIPFAVALWYKPWLSAAIGASWWIVPLSIMALLATTGPFIYIYLNRKAEEKLFKEQKRYQDTLKQASLGMTRIRDLKKLLELIVHIITRAVRITYAGIYLLDRENSHYKLEAMRAKENKGTVSPRIEMSSSLVKWLLDKKEPLVTGEIKRQLQDKPQKDLEELKDQMGLMNAAVVVPSFVGNKLLAFMVLGDKSSGEIYTQDDLHVFTVLANQAALAIENARFFEDAKEMQEQISQAEKMATIGTMADGLSHQINNRFHALSLIAGDTLDTLKLADTQHYAQAQKDLLSQIRYGLERIQANVLQGGEVVKGMLKYTRKGEEGFSAVTLDKIIDATLEMVQYKIKLHSIDIIRDYPQSTPALNGNLTQLQEVFFNLIDNAYDAMMERKDVLKEEGYRGKIRIYTEDAHNGYLKIKVEDNGIGARPEDFKKMFTPFFTTKVSSRKGTGLGLYVIKKIVSSNHNGKISVESHYKQGTTFILELPVAIREKTIQ